MTLNDLSVVVLTVFAVALLAVLVYHIDDHRKRKKQERETVRRRLDEAIKRQGEQ